MIVKKAFLLFILLSAYARLSAQLCRGSLGDAIINITFGSGPNPGPVLNTTKNLNFVYNDCPGDGFYTIRNNTDRCFGNTWHSLTSDHTGDANGYFMLINASVTKSEFYIDTLKGLCPSTTYEFAAWVTNVLRPTACFGNGKTPNLTFNIEKTDGTVLQTYKTGDIAAVQNPTWNQYGSFFTTPSNVTSVVLRLINNSDGGCGNDLAIDDITFRPCGPQLMPSIRSVPDRLKVLCFGDKADLVFECTVSAGYSDPAYLWQQSKDGGGTWTDIAGQTNNTMLRSFPSNTPVGKYLFRLTVGEASNIGLATCRVSSAALTVEVKNNPVTSISTNSPACQGSNITLSATGGTQESQYVWSGVNSFSATGSSVLVKNAQQINAGKYYVQVTNSDGCRHTDSVVVSIKPAPVISTSFTSKSICLGESVGLNSSGGSSYLWSPATGLSSIVIPNPVAKPTDSITYQVVISNSASCKDSATVSINVIPKPIANAGPDKEMVEGQAVQLEGKIIGNYAGFVWSPGLFINNTRTLQPTVDPITNTSYILTANSDNGCGSSSDTAFVRVYKKITIPNAFSPNADGINDTWNITALNSYDNYQLSVFNHYGRVVYSTKNYRNDWNGTYNGAPLPVGTYYYVLDLKSAQRSLNGYVVILK